MSTLRELAENLSAQGELLYMRINLAGLPVAFVDMASPTAILDLYDQIDKLKADHATDLHLIELAQDTAGRMLAERDAARIERDKYQSRYEYLAKRIARMKT